MMPDMEKVIKGLKCCNYYGFHEDCPYDKKDPNEEQDTTCMMDLMRDALALLKEQEAMEPIEEFRKGANCHVYHCKRCGNIVGTILGGKRPIAKLSIEHFCDVCGQAVKWE